MSVAELGASAHSTPPDEQTPNSKNASAPGRALWWVVIIVVALLFASLFASLRPASLAASASFDDDSSAPGGARALTTLLEDHGGSSVRSVRTLEDAVTEARGHTLVVGRTSPLDNDDLVELAEAAERIVLISPTSRDLEVLFDGSFSAGYAGATADPACASPVASTAGAATIGSIYEPGGGATGCYQTGDGYGVIEYENRVAFDGATILVNSALALEGNAALAMGTIGLGSDVIWYLPSWQGSVAGTEDALAAITPAWVTPAIILLVFTMVAASLWRGRRFGPLVAETLPVTVRSGETLAGRARLYGRAHDAAHEGALLTEGARARLARQVALSPFASIDEIAGGVHARFGVPSTMAADILRASPTTSAELVDLARRIRELERAMRRTTDRKDRT